MKHHTRRTATVSGPGWRITYYAGTEPVASFWSTEPMQVAKAAQRWMEAA